MPSSDITYCAEPHDDVRCDDCRREGAPWNSHNSYATFPGWRDDGPCDGYLPESTAPAAAESEAGA